MCLPRMFGEICCVKHVCWRSNISPFAQREKCFLIPSCLLRQGRKITAILRLTVSCCATSCLQCGYKCFVVTLQLICSATTTRLQSHYKSVCTLRSLNGDVLRAYFGPTSNAYKVLFLPMSYFLIYTRVRDKSKSVCKLPRSTSWRDNHFFICPVLFRGHGILSRMC